MKLVVVESPFAGNVPLNLAYARRCVRDCLRRGEAPIASHLLYTQEGILNDTIPEERELGIAAGLAWARHAKETALYVDLGVSRGMSQGIVSAMQSERLIAIRCLDMSRDEQKVRAGKLAEVLLAFAVEHGMDHGGLMQEDRMRMHARRSLKEEADLAMKIFGKLQEFFPVPS